MSFIVTLPSPSSSSSSSSSFSNSHQKPHSFTTHPNLKLTVRFHSVKSPPPVLQASRRISNFPSKSLADDPRNWSRSINSEFATVEDDDDDDDEDEEEEDRSLDLLVRFVQNVFKKISKRARKAVRSVLPVSISTKLVEFSVNGVLLLAFLWILKAFLEVVCTLGSVVFVSILLIRGVWSGVTYLQERRNLKMNELDYDRRVWTGTQPAS